MGVVVAVVTITANVDIVVVAIVAAAVKFGIPRRRETPRTGKTSTGGPFCAWGVQVGALLRTKVPYIVLAGSTSTDGSTAHACLPGASHRRKDCRDKPLLVSVLVAFVRGVAVGTGLKSSSSPSLSKLLSWSPRAESRRQRVVRSRQAAQHSARWRNGMVTVAW